MSRQWQLHLAAVGFFFNVYTYLIDTTHLSKYFSTNPKTIFDAFDRKGALPEAGFKQVLPFIIHF